MPPLASDALSPPAAPALRALDLTDRALLASALQEIEHLRGALLVAQRARAESDRRAQSISADNDRLRHDLGQRQHLLDTLSADVAQLRADLLAIDRDLSSACRSEAERADQAIASLEETTQRLTAAATAADERASEALTSRDTQLAALSTKHTAELQAQRSETERAKSRADAFKTERDEAREQALEQRRRCAQLERDLQQASILTADLQRRLNASPPPPSEPTLPPSPPPTIHQHTPLSELKTAPTIPSSAPSLWLSARALDPLAERVALDERLRLAILDLHAREQRIRSLELQLDQLRHRLRRSYPSTDNTSPKP